LAGSTPLQVLAWGEEKWGGEKDFEAGRKNLANRRAGEGKGRKKKREIGVEGTAYSTRGKKRSYLGAEKVADSIERRVKTYETRGASSQSCRGNDRAVSEAKWGGESRAR